MSGGSRLAFRWLGAGGLEFQAGGRILLVDPFFTRPPLRALLTLARVPPDAALVAGCVEQADDILVTHAHYDHLLDVPEVLRLTGARAYGSANTCSLLAQGGLPAGRRVLVRPGDQMELGPFTVEVFPGYHIPTPIDRLINGRLPGRLRFPPRLIDYRMDACYAYRIQAGGQSLLAGSHPVPAELLFLIPYLPEDLLRSLLDAVSPRRVVLVHWDDFTRPLARPLRPMLGIRRGWPPLARLDLPDFARRVRDLLPGADVLVPELFQVYPVEDGSFP